MIDSIKNLKDDQASVDITEHTVVPTLVSVATIGALTALIRKVKKNSKQKSPLHELTDEDILELWLIDEVK